MMMIQLIKSFILLALVIGIAACGDTRPAHSDSLTSGTIHIAVDETYKPIMEEQIKVFEGRNLEAKIIAHYKPEADCIKDFINDTLTRLIFVTRPLTDQEKSQCEDKKVPITRTLAMARDGIAFIVNKTSQDEYTQADFEAILKGKKGDTKIVFDHTNSSTFRQVQDSILKGEPISKNMFAVKDCNQVVEYIKNNKNAVGVIGVPYISDREDSTANQFLTTINVIGILPFNDTITTYRKPYQAYIGLREYPYTREFTFISKETHHGLGSGFVNYLCREGGQLVFSKNKLFPLRMNVYLRDVKID
jgi:phosphate transport system substrate-binding protein